MKTEIFKSIPFEEKQKEIKEIWWELYKRWIIENKGDKIFIWHFLSFIDLKLANKEDMIKENEIVLSVYYHWLFLRKSLDNQPSYVVKIIYDLFLKIKNG